MKTTSKIILYLFFSNCFMYSQVTQEWVARYDFISDDWANDIAIDPGENVYVTGRSKAANGQTDYATIKYNSAGVLQWVMRYNGPGNNLDEANSIIVDSAGNVYVTGFSRSGPDAVYNDFATIKYNSAGAQQWVRRYNGGGSDIAKRIIIDNNGNIFVGGWSTRAGTGADFTVIKYNPQGDSLWVRIYDSGSDGNYDYGEDMAVDNAGNVYLTGVVGLNISPAPDWVTVKWNSQGVFQWAERLNGPGNGSDYPQAITVSDSGNVYVTGFVWGNNNGDYATVKYNTAGMQQWVVYYNGGSVFTAHDVAYSITVDNMGNSYVTGRSTNPNYDNNDYATIKYSAGGTQLWVTRFNGNINADDEPCCIKLDTNGNVYVTGYSMISLPANKDYCTIKYNNSGVEQWTIYYGATSNSGDVSSALAIAINGNVYVTGLSVIGNADYATIKYSQATGITQITNEIPEEFELYQNYPNPFNPVTKIRFSIPLLRGVASEGGRGVFVTLRVFDILGREAETVVNGMLNPGIYEVDFNASNYSSGVYYYRLETSNYSETRKMIILK